MVRSGMNGVKQFGATSICVDLQPYAIICKTIAAKFAICLQGLYICFP